MMETPLRDNTRSDPIVIASIGVVFSQASKFNIKYRVGEIEEYKLKI
jgi:hypothetical protein